MIFISTDMTVTKLILIYFLLINIVTFFAYGIDKLRAKKDKWRIPESTLIWFAIIGGSIGALLGMKVWHHKTLHNKFRIGVPFILIVQLTVVGYLIYLAVKN